jgi:uncharacterized protein YbjT (DUF2867 family)
MKITLTGSLGNIGEPLVKLLVAAGHNVTVISSKADKVAEIEALGATAAIGLITDAAFLTQAFTGANVVYTMVPPNFGASNYREYIGEIGKNYAEAIQKAGITKVVNLSSVGADLDAGTGPIAGIHDVELILNALPNVAVKHLRAGFFYVNFYSNIDMIKQLGFMGANYGAANHLLMVHPADIAAAIAEEIESEFKSNSVRYVVSDERTLGEVTKVLGTAIGKPDLAWVEFTDQQSHDGMVQAGLPEEMARIYTEMGVAARNGLLSDDFKAQKAAITGKTKLEDFAGEFAEKFNVVVI